MPHPLRALLLTALLAAPLAAVSVDELVEAVLEDIPEDVLLEPGNTTLPEKLATLDGDDFGLDPQQAVELRLRVAEAWLGADRPDEAEAAALLVLGQDLDAPLRDRAGLVLVAAWELRLDQSEDPARLPDPLQALQAVGPFGPEVEARARVVEARRRLAEGGFEAAIHQLDAALALLEEATARARVPVYALRVLAMESSGQAPEAIEAWLQQRVGDPAVDLILASLLTDSQKLVGQPAPALEIPYADRPGLWQLADAQNRVLVLYFFATWCKPCAEVTPAVVHLAAAEPEAMVVGISLDNQDTVGRLGDYIARYGITWPVVSEQLGWDGEADDQLHVEAIPHIVIIGPAGRIAAVDLIGPDPQSTLTQLREAVQAAAGPAAAPAGPAGEDIP